MHKFTFESLPYFVKSRILDNIDLEYDGYESSRAECVDSLLSSGTDSYLYNCNKDAIERAIKNLTIETLRLYTAQKLESLAWETKVVNDFLNELEKK